MERADVIDTEVSPRVGGSGTRPHRVTVSLGLVAVVGMAAAVMVWLGSGDGEQRLQGSAASDPSDAPVTVTGGGADTAPTVEVTVESTDTTTDVSTSRDVTTLTSRLPTPSGEPALVAFSSDKPLTFDRSAVEYLPDLGDTPPVGAAFRVDVTLDDGSGNGGGSGTRVGVQVSVPIPRADGVQRCDSHGAAWSPIDGKSGRSFWAQCWIGTGFAPGTYPIVIDITNDSGTTWKKQVATATFTGEFWRDAAPPALVRPVVVSQTDYSVTFDLYDLAGVEPIVPMSNPWGVLFRLARDVNGWDCPVVLIAGTTTSGTYTASCSNFAFIPQGTYEMLLQAQDVLGQRMFINLGPVTWSSGT